MQKRGRVFFKTVGYGEISLFVLSVFAFGFIVGETERVAAEDYWFIMNWQGEKIIQKSSISALTSEQLASGQYFTSFDAAKQTLQGIDTAPLSAGFGYQDQNSPGSSLQTAGGTPGPSGQSPDTLKGLGLAEISKSTLTEWTVSEGNLALQNGQKLIGVQKVVSPEGVVSHRGVLPSGEALDIPESTFNDAFNSPGVDLSLKGEKVTEILSFKFTGGWGYLVEGLQWSLLVVGAIQLIGPLLGLDEKLTNALSAAAFAGIMTYEGILSLTQQNFGAILAKDNLLVQYAGPIGIGVAVVVFVMLYKKEAKKVVELQCLPWEAPLGGADCEKCNQDPLKPCSEYRCKSLGQACELVNKGSVEERCTWVSRNDVNSPTITPWGSALSAGHKYTDMQGRPPSRGTKIARNDAGDGCIKPFTPLEFGVILNEPAQCKIDVVGNKTFDEMQYYFGETNLYRYNHTQSLRLPSPSSVNAEGPEVPNEGAYNFYVRCRDANGNVNDDEFVFNLCVDKSPDTTPPVIESTSIVSGSPVTFGAEEINITAYVNEPADCRWSIQDKTYNLMENNMSCSEHVYEQNAKQLYPCSTKLTGVKDNFDNAFFFRCKDQPLKPENERNVNQESYRFTLKGTQPLNILNAGPNETFTGSTSIIPVNLSVTTDDGADEGIATCFFSPTGNPDSYIKMFETNNYQHKQILTLSSGNYNYFFRCVDDGGNAATANISFNVFVDRNAPAITRVYKEGVDALKLVTNEKATCMYSITSCNFVFDEGVRMLWLDTKLQTTHAAQWKASQTYYIKCRDDYGNEPSPNACSVIASASTVL